MKNRIILLLCFWFLSETCVKAQKVFTVAFYNTENLMDTLDNPHAQDNDFLPKGKYKWTSKRYHQKLEAISTVISTLGDPDGPEVIGLAEVENRAVLKDLTNTKKLKSSAYQIVHYDSPDERGIDVALLYKTKSFRLISSTKYTTASLNIRSHTRDVLLVKGISEKDTLFLFVNHWPSRRKGTEETEEKRLAVAMMVRRKIDSIQQKNPSAKIMLLGDFNDEPDNTSVQVKLRSKAVNTALSKPELFNPFSNLSKAGGGSVNFHHQWNMFDQILMSKGFFQGKSSLKYTSAAVYHPAWLHYKRDFKSGPYRTFLGADYKGGYSDHFPVYVSFERK